MIPKKIHYCWFGGNPLDETSRKCISSWGKYFPDYEIIQWNEDNFDISQIEFMQKAYDEKKWAFVSDVARLLIIYEHGGFYFDTDVEVIRTFDDILEQSPDGYLAYEKLNCVSTGLGFGMPPKHPLLEELIELYRDLDFDTYKNRLSEIACPILTTTLLQRQGYVPEDRMQRIRGLDVYPSEYFSPIDYETGKMLKTGRTHSIHWYNASWNDVQEKKYRHLEQKCMQFLGKRLGSVTAGIVHCIRREGLVCYLRRRLLRVKR